MFYAETKADWAISPFRSSLIDLKINQPSHAAVTFWQTASLLHLSTAGNVTSLKNRNFSTRAIQAA